MVPGDILPLLTTVLLALLVLLGAVGVVILANLFRAALCLGVVLVGVAGLFLVLQAAFLAFVQILIYVGAILTLLVFAIMLTAGVTGASGASARRSDVAAPLALALFAVLAITTQTLAWPQPAQEPVAVAALGQQLVTTLILPFEVVSLVFVAAIVGAVALAAPSKRRRPSA